MRLGRLAGIPIGVQPLWLVIVGLLTYSLGHDYFPQEDPGLSDPAAYVLGFVSALGLFAGILLHELGHAVVARRRGVEVDEIDLWLLGGVSRMHGEPDQPGDELRYAAAGPAVTLAILAVLVPARLALGGALPDWGRALLDYQVYVTGAIFVFNVLPAFPLDGGRMVRALLWRRTGDREAATARAATGGTVFGWTLVALGLLALASGLVGGLWLALVGGFLILAAAAEAQGMATKNALGGLHVGDLMTPSPATLRADLTLDEAVVVGFARHLYTAFPVVDERGRTLGIVAVDDIRKVPHHGRARFRVADVMVVDPALETRPSTAVQDLVERPAFAAYGRAVVLDDDGRPVGLISITDVQRRLRADALLPPVRHAA